MGAAEPLDDVCVAERIRPVAMDAWNLDRQGMTHAAVTLVHRPLTFTCPMISSRRSTPASTHSPLPRTLPNATRLSVIDELALTMTDHQGVDDHDFNAILTHSGLYAAARDNDIEPLNQLLQGRTFSIHQVLILHEFAGRYDARQSADAIALLRSVKAGEAFPGYRPFQGPMPVELARQLPRWLEFFSSAVVREDMDEVRNHLDDRQFGADEFNRMEKIIQTVIEPGKAQDRMEEMLKDARQRAGCPRS